MSFSIAGKTAIVTGAASGIGRAVALQFAEAGANVMCVDTDDAELAEQFGDREKDGNILHFSGDLREKLTVANLLSATLDGFEQIDILVNASREFAPSDPMDTDDDHTSKLIERNMTTALRLSQQVAKRMIKQAEGREEGGAGAIVNLSSTVTSQSNAEQLAYSVAAASVNQMTRSLALALAPSRVRVNAVALGSVMSASMQAALKGNKKWRAEIEEATPLGRIGSPSELTDVVQFLASDASSFVTGQVLTVDGGRSLVDPISVLAH